MPELIQNNVNGEKMYIPIRLMILPKSELYPFTEAFNNIKNLIVFLLKHEVGVVFMKQKIISIL